MGPDPSEVDLVQRQPSGLSILVVADDAEPVEQGGMRLGCRFLRRESDVGRDRRSDDGSRDHGRSQASVRF